MHPNIKDYLSKDVMTMTVGFVEIDDVVFTLWVVSLTYSDPRGGLGSLSSVPFH